MTRPTVALSALHGLYAASLFPMPQAILCGILILIPSSWWCIGALWPYYENDLPHPIIGLVGLFTGLPIGVIAGCISTALPLRLVQAANACGLLALTTGIARSSF